MAVAWLGSGGAPIRCSATFQQAVVWPRRLATREYLFSEPGRCDLSDAFYFNNQSITWQLQTRFPSRPRSIATSGTSRGAVDGGWRSGSGHTQDEPGLKDDLGLLWDHDTVAFYGDPAWDARLAPQPAKFSQKLSVDGDRYTFTLHADDDCSPGRPPAIFLPHRVRDIKIVEGEKLKPLVTSKFIMVMEPGKLEKGKTYKVIFEAKEVDRSAEARLRSRKSLDNQCRPAIDRKIRTGEVSQDGGNSALCRPARIATSC